MAKEPLPPDYRRNLFALGGDYIAFNAAMAFVDQSTVMPAFARELTSSAPLIGLVSTIHSGGWLLPQLFAANYVSHQRRKKPFIMWPVGIGRPMMPLMAVLIYLYGLKAPGLVLGALYLTQAVFWVADGLASVPWFDVLAKAFPGRLRGRYLAISQVGGGILAIGAGAVVRRILDADTGLAFPNNYGLLFSLSSVFFVLSFFLMALLKEPVESTHEERLSWRKYATMLAGALKGDRRFALAVTGRMLSGLGNMALPFYIIYGTEGLDLGVSVVGLCLTAKVVGSIVGGLLLGWGVERMGNRFTILGALAMTMLAPVMALGLGLLGGTLLDQSVLYYLYPVTFLFVGISLSTANWSFTNYILDIAPSKDRATYVGLTNTLGGLLVLAPVLGGAILDATSFGALFAISLTIFALATMVVTRLPRAEAQPTGA